MSGLRSCPFCGGEAKLKHDHRWPYGCDRAIDACIVVCTNMDCNIYDADGVYYRTEAEAVKAWNTRTERTCHETTIDKFFRGCDSCGYMWEVFYGIGKRECPNYCPNCGAKVVKE